MSHVLRGLRCEHCGAEVVRDDLQPEHGIAICSLCHTVLVLKGDATPRAPAAQLAPPRWFSPVTGGVTWRASPWPVLGAVFFLLFWAAFPWPPQAQLMKVMGIAVICISGLKSFVRGGLLAFDGRWLNVERFGVPASRRFSLEARDVVEIYWVDESTPRNPRYAVKALMRDGTERELVEQLAEADHARYIVQELERARAHR
jgi:hypothetical protein